MEATSTEGENIEIKVESYSSLFEDEQPEESNTENIKFSEFYKTNELTDANKWSFNDMYVRSNSPMASNCNSDVDTDIQEILEDEDEFALSSPRSAKRISALSFEHNSSHHHHNHHQYFRKIHRRIEPPRKVREEEEKDADVNTGKKYKKFTYEDIEKSLSQYYDKNEKNFTDTDLLITYLKGMRALYVISRNITQLKSYSVAMATISITICLAVVAPFVKDVVWGAYLISSGNALATLLISLSRYLKFDSNSAQYAFMAKQFNKLEMRIEYENENPTSQKMRDVEFAMMEMQEYIQELIPEEAVQLFPIIYRTNIMQFIKKTGIYRKNLIIRFRDIKNEIHYILHKWNTLGEKMDKTDKTPQQEREKNRVVYLMDLKEKTKKELMQFNNIYGQLDDLFKREIRYAESHQCCLGCVVYFKPDHDYAKLNPILRDYLKLVIPE